MEKLTNFYLPTDLGEFDIAADEVMYYLYLPIKMPGEESCIVPDDRLNFIIPLINKVREADPERFQSDYLYATVKKMFVGGGVTANRPGWHCDGFLSTDLNYVWYDSVPTVFISGDFSITPDHVKSLAEFEEQAEAREGGGLKNNHIIYPVKHLLRLDDKVIHRVDTDVPNQLMRTFVKLTLSKNRFNLKDNSRNPFLPDNGPMYDRSLVRNDPYQAQRDYYKPVVDDHFA